jgi:hypothetical protein
MQNVISFKQITQQIALSLRCVCPYLEFSDPILIEHLVFISPQDSLLL